MGLAYNEKTGEIILYMDRKFITREEALEMWPMQTEKESDEPD